MVRRGSLPLHARHEGGRGRARVQGRVHEDRGHAERRDPRERKAREVQGREPPRRLAGERTLRHARGDAPRRDSDEAEQCRHRAHEPLSERSVLLPPLRALRTLRHARGEHREPRDGLRRVVARLPAELDAGARGARPRHGAELAQLAVRVHVELGQRGGAGPDVRRRERGVPETGRHASDRLPAGQRTLRDRRPHLSDARGDARARPPLEVQFLLRVRPRDGQRAWQLQGILGRVLRLAVADRRVHLGLG